MKKNTLLVLSKLINGVEIRKNIMSKLLKSKFLFGALVVTIMFVGVVAISAKTASADCTITTTLRVGSTGVEVSCLQTVVGATADGKFGPLTKASVMAWQSGHGLVADGVFGPKSNAVLRANGAVSGNFPAGCQSASGFSPTTGLPCNSVNANTFAPTGCTSTSGFSSVDGSSCGTPTQTLSITTSCTNGATNSTCIFACNRCSLTNNYTRATFDSDSSDCNSTTAHNTNVVYSCDSSCGIAPGINGVGANTTYNNCAASSPTTPIITTSPSTCSPTVYSEAAAAANAGITGNAIMGIAFDGTNIWTANADIGHQGTATNGFDSVMKITPSGDITTYTGTGISPYAIAFDGTNMWTASPYGSVTKITPSGAMTTYKGGVQPNGLAFDGTNMWVSDRGIDPHDYGSECNGIGRVMKITPSGVMTTYTIGADEHPTSIAFDGTNMWTVSHGGCSIDNGAGSVTKISPSGVVTTYSSVEAFSPVSIAFDGTNMWTANAMSGPAAGINSVTKITPSGAMTTYPGGHTQNKFFHPIRIAFDGTNMWTANSDGGMTRITPSGAMTTYPSGTIGIGGTDRNFNNVAGSIVFDGTNMWVATGGSGIDKINVSSACLPQSPALPIITNTSLPGGTFGSPYTVTLGSTVGAGLYRIWAVTGLPAGLSLNGVSSGAISGLVDTMYPGSGASPTISGTPSAVGTYNVTVTLTTTSNYVSGCNLGGSVCYDPVYQAVSKQFSLVVGNVLGAKSFNFTQLLQEGSHGNEVIELQKFLNVAGYDAGNVDGIFGPKVKAALIKFQIANNLKSDGIVGFEVRTLLNK